MDQMIRGILGVRFKKYKCGIKSLHLIKNVPVSGFLTHFQFDSLSVL